MLSRFGTTFVRKMSSNSGVVAPLSNRVFLFNWFEKPPMDDKAFFDFWADTAYYVQKQDHFISTHLHQGLGRNSKFAWVNFAVFDSNDICVFGKPDPKWAKRMEGHANLNLTLYPGEYNEIGSYNGNSIDDSDKTRSDESRFLLTAVTADNSVSNEDLESNWASLTKADFIHDKLASNSVLKDSLLYRMARARNPLIRYTIRTELSSMDEKEGIEFAEMVDAQQNAKGIKTYTGFFKVHTDMYYKKD